MFIDIFPPASVKFNEHEMDKDYSGWSLKHRVDLTQVMTKFPDSTDGLFKALAIVCYKYIALFWRKKKKMHS